MSCYHKTGLQSDYTLCAWPNTSRSAVKAHYSARLSLARTAQRGPSARGRDAAIAACLADIRRDRENYSKLNSPFARTKLPLAKHLTLVLFVVE